MPHPCSTNQRPYEHSTDHLLTSTALALGGLWVSSSWRPAAASDRRPGYSRAQAAPAAQTAQPVAIYFFWGNGCPHCAKAKPFLEELSRTYPNVAVRAYEVWYDEANQTLFKQMAAAYGFEPSAVPTIFIGDRHWVGFAEQTRHRTRSGGGQLLGHRLS